MFHLIKGLFCPVRGTSEGIKVEIQLDAHRTRAQNLLESTYNPPDNDFTDVIGSVAFVPTSRWTRRTGEVTDCGPHIDLTISEWGWTWPREVALVRIQKETGYVTIRTDVAPLKSLGTVEVRVVRENLNRRPR